MIGKQGEKIDEQGEKIDEQGEKMEEQVGGLRKDIEHIKIATSDISSQSSTSSRPRKLRSRLLDVAGRNCCILTGNSNPDELTLAHIIPHSELWKMPRDAEYGTGKNYTSAHKSSLNMAFLRSDLEQSYDDYKWSFDASGAVHILYDGFKGLSVFERGMVSLPVVEPLHPEVVRARHELALLRSAERCPMCWKKVMESNLDVHRRSSCPHEEKASSP
jgi:hypothetical protein